MKKANVSFKMMMVAFMASILLLASAATNPASALTVIISTRYGGSNCTFNKGFCIIIRWETNLFTAGPGRGQAEVDINSAGKLHVVFHDSLSDNGIIDVTGNYFIGTPVSHTLGYEEVTILPGTYAIDYSTLTQYGEATFDVQLTGPIPNAPVSSNCYPPISKQLSGNKFHNNALNQIVFDDIKFEHFSSCVALPTSGSATIPFQGQGSLVVKKDTTVKKVDFGMPSPGHTTLVRATPTGTNGDVTSYDMEMLECNIDMPANTLPGYGPFKIRESPTLPSRGGTEIRALPGGGYRIISFFDVFTEVSFDNGTTWSPSDDGPSHIEMQDQTTASVPTLSEWGLISLAGLMLSIGVFYLRRTIG